MIRRLVRFVDQRSGTAPLLRKTLRYLFPDHWSFLLGEVALYCVRRPGRDRHLPDALLQRQHRDVVYHGPYAPLRAQHMTEAYRSVLDLSTTVKAGLLIRQTHHWAADVFLAAIVLHLLRVFFTGAYRKPRELTYWLGLTILMVALLEGFLGYSLADDLLSGMGLAIALRGRRSRCRSSAPTSRRSIWDGPFPGRARRSSRGCTSRTCS